MSENQAPENLKVIDAFLKANLLGNLGADEERYQYLGNTVGALQAKFKEDPRALIRFSLVAFQPKPSDKASDIILVYEVLKEYWKLIDNVYRGDRPVILLQAVMLEAICKLCNSDGRLASIVYYANSSTLPHHKYGVHEGSLFKQVLTTAAVKAEKFAATRYTSPTKVKEKLDFDIIISAPDKIIVDQATLQQGLLAAAGPSDENGQPLSIEPANPHWPQSSQAWSKPFSDIAAKTIAQSIVSSIDESLTEFATDASQVISGRLKKLAGYTSKKMSFEMELKVLWWMQSLYSVRLRSSYRDLAVTTAVIAMVYDLFEQVDIPALESVVHVLGEAILNAVSDMPAKNRKAVKLSQWLEALRETGVLTNIKPLEIHSSDLENHTQSLISVVRFILDGGRTPSQEMLGDLLDVTLTPRQFGMWLFCDLIAERLAEEK